jgi:hypothetical protein
MDDESEFSLQNTEKDVGDMGKNIIKDVGNAGTELFSILSSTNVLAVIAFFILVVVAFTIVLRLGIAFISYLFSTRNHAKLITGIVDGNVSRVFPQDPSLENSVTIERSNNAKGGIEFTWSVWLNFTSVSKNGMYQNIFFKGNSNIGDNGGINTPNNAPGLYLAPGTNSLLFIMNTFEVINEEIIIPDIPMNKWINVVMTCQNKTINIYVNGVVSRSQTLIGVPKQNYGDVYVALGGGFDGYLSNLWYWNKTLSITDIQNLYTRGPNTKSFSTDLSSYKRKSSANYLSLQWYLNG